MRSPGVYNLLGLLLAATIGLAGCSRPNEEPADVSPGPPKRARSEVERGPVKVAVAVDPSKARLSDEPKLTLTIDYQQGVTVEKPPFGEAIGEFVIRDFHEPLPKIQENREIIQQVYTLEPTQTGDLEIWPIAVRFTDTRPDGDGKQHTIETETLTVQVASVLGTESPSLAGLRPNVDPMALPASPWVAVWASVVAVALAVAGGVTWWLWRRRKKVEAVKPLTPGELARLELERLLAQNLAEEDVALFYVELTGVVRRYIERTTGIRAPEQTTEEFLREISSEDTFPPDEKRRLKSFLESADLVKFAAYRPQSEAIDEAVERARVFIGLENETMEVVA